MEDFVKTKICWNRIASVKVFALVDEGIVIQDSMHFFTGEHLPYLNIMLNSHLYSFLLYLIVGEAAGGNAGNADNVKNLSVLKPTSKQEQDIIALYKAGNYAEMDNMIYFAYGLTPEEVAFIENMEG